jgi:predicted nucleotidyltransferase
VVIDRITEDEIEEMARRIVAEVDPVKVILFGSHANGTAQAGSDVDLLVIQRDPVREREEAARLRGLLRDYRVPIDIVVVGQAFADRYWDIPGSVLYPAFREGKVLYG